MPEHSPVHWMGHMSRKNLSIMDFSSFPKVFCLEQFVLQEA